MLASARTPAPHSLMCHSSDFLALFAWLHKDALIERLSAMDVVDDGSALTPEGRLSSRAQRYGFERSAE